MRLGDGPDTNVQLSALTGFPKFASGYLSHVLQALSASLIFFLFFFLLRVLLRREWLAAVTFVALFAGIRGLPAEHAAVQTLMYIFIYGFLVALLLRYGFLAVVVCLFVTDTMISFAFTPDFSAWYGTSSLLTVLSLIALALFAVRTSTAGKPLFGGLLDR